MSNDRSPSRWGRRPPDTMLTPSGSVLLLLSYCLFSAVAQSDGQSIWDNPIEFKTKSEDLCTMIITGQGEYTKLRLSCQGSGRSYWCEYLGMPHTCRSYNKNPRHFFVQLMWNLRKLQNACQGPKLLRPHMCKKAPDDSRMAFQSASFSQSDASAVTEAGLVAGSDPPKSLKSFFSWSDPRRGSQVSTSISQTNSPQPTTAPPESNAKRIARQYCWRSLQGVCSFLIGWFRH